MKKIIAYIFLANILSISNTSLCMFNMLRKTQRSCHRSCQQQKRQYGMGVGIIIPPKDYDIVLSTGIKQKEEKLHLLLQDPSSDPKIMYLLQREIYQDLKILRMLRAPYKKSNSDEKTIIE